MRKGFASDIRLHIVCIVVLAVFVGVGLRLVQLHWIDAERYADFLEKTRKKIMVEDARRGQILDARNNVLATSRVLIELGVDPLALRTKDEDKWPELARLLGRTLAEIEPLMRTRFTPATANSDELRSSIRWTKLSEEVEESTYDEILKLGIKGVYGNRHYRRTYPGGAIAAHILGYINKENTAVTGVERFMDFYLTGQRGWRESEVDGRRRELAQFRSREVAAADGYDVGLTIDMVIQHIVEKELQHIAHTFNPEAATIIVSHPASGAILALGNWPTYDPNHFSTAPLASQRNIAVTDVFEPGSTFKIVASAGALNEGLVTTSTMFDCASSTVFYQGKPRSLPKDAHPFERLSVAEIVGKSSNRGAAHLGVTLGANRLYEYAHAFGFGEETGFPFGGEVSGVLHKVKNWDGLTITRLPMGHAISATPMQIHYAMGVIASGGELVRPWIIREIRDPSSNEVIRYEPQITRRVVKQQTAETVARLLVDAASAEGTGQAAAINGYEVAGKTGTTQMIIDGKYSSAHHVSSFVGFFPASRPQVAISVFVKNGRPPKGGLAYGGIVAAPSFKRIGEQIIPYLGIKPVGIAQPQLALNNSRFVKRP